MRAFKLALLILALVPTVFLRGPRPVIEAGGLGLVDLMPALRAGGPLPNTGALRLEGAWQITGHPPGSGTFSGLAQSGGGFVSVGDRGALLRFARPDRGPWQPRLDRLFHLDWRRYHYPTDAESITIVPGSGDFLVGYEDSPALGRFSADLARHSVIPVPALSEWPPNQGPESMAILADGRTVIIGEGYARWLDRQRA
jgi:Esterase-like activity of phytase